MSACLALLCSCTTELKWSDDNSARPPLPAETAFNKSAGHGDHLYIKLRLENGREMLFAVDTGMSVTMLDKSLEPMLGKRLTTTNFTYKWIGKMDTGVYQAPKLYLGDTQLLTNDWICTEDLQSMSDGQPLMGILGMDCLRHYCLQLDFSADKMRFLDPDHLNGESPGKKFPLSIDTTLATTRASLFGLRETDYVVDTGETVDAALKPKLFQQVLREHTAYATGQIQATVGKSSVTVPDQEASFTAMAFNDETYGSFILDESADENLIGLRFMSRYLVTLNFPQRTMYLQRRSDDPFADEASFTYAEGCVLTMEAAKFSAYLKDQGQLPGWVNDEDGEAAWVPDWNGPELYPVTRTFEATKKGDVSKYHYTFGKASKDSKWRLQKAWHTDASGKILNEYPVP